MTEITRVPFHGTEIVTNDDGTQIALKPVCEAIGLDAYAQQKRLKRQPWATTSMMDAVASDGKSREMLTVDRRTFTMWLATIDTSRVKDQDARALVVAYQTEAADALDRYFHDGGVINPRATEHQVNALIRQAQMQMELCQAAKGLIDADHLQAKARIILARGMGEAPQIDPQSMPLYTQDFLRDKNLSRNKLRSVMGNFGKAVKAAYIKENGVAPNDYMLEVGNGQVRPVKAYTEADRPLMERVWAEKFAAKVGGAR